MLANKLIKYHYLINYYIDYISLQYIIVTL